MKEVATRELVKKKKEKAQRHCVNMKIGKMTCLLDRDVD